MNSIEKLDKIYDMVKHYKWPRDFNDESFCPQSAFGGNFDDAYQGGLDHGEAYLGCLIQEIIDLE